MQNLQQKMTFWHKNDFKIWPTFEWAHKKDITTKSLPEAGTLSPKQAWFQYKHTSTLINGIKLFWKQPGVIIVNLLSQLWCHRNDRRRALNNMLCDNNNVTTIKMVPNNNMLEETLVDSHIPYISPFYRIYHIVFIEFFISNGLYRTFFIDAR